MHYIFLILSIVLFAYGKENTNCIYGGLLMALLCVLFSGALNDEQYK